MNYNEAMNYIKNTAKFGSKYGLDRTKKILELLGEPHNQLRCVHIAGTNGKGSTTAMISNILMAAGYKVGMYTSPYLEEFEERIQIDNINIPKERLCSVVEKVSRAVEEVIALGYDHPTEFEIITCAMFLYFYEEKVDLAVIEVGLGGRLDSTNVIVPIVSVITSISYDHMNILGDTLEAIAYEKAGIIKESIPVVSYPQPEDALKVIEKVCGERGCHLKKVKAQSGELISVNGIHQKVSVSTEKDKYVIDLALLGEYQINNCSVVINTIETLMDLGVKVSKKNIMDGLYNVRWKGRMEVLKVNPTVLMDGAHNIDGITKLSESISKYFKYENMYLIIGILADKQVDKMLKMIVPMAKDVFAVTPHSERAEEAHKLREKILSLNQGCRAYDDYKEAYDMALSKCSDKDLLVICGSLYMIGDMRKIIRQQ